MFAFRVNKFEGRLFIWSSFDRLSSEHFGIEDTKNIVLKQK